MAIAFSTRVQFFLFCLDLKRKVKNTRGKLKEKLCVQLCYANNVKKNNNLMYLPLLTTTCNKDFLYHHHHSTHLSTSHTHFFIFYIFTCLCFFLKPRLWKLLKISTLLFFLHFLAIEMKVFLFFSLLLVLLIFRCFEFPHKKKISYGNLVLVIIGGGKGRECVDFHLCE